MRLSWDSKEGQEEGKIALPVSLVKKNSVTIPVSENFLKTIYRWHLVPSNLKKKKSTKKFPELSYYCWRYNNPHADFVY